MANKQWLYRLTGWLYITVAVLVIVSAVLVSAARLWLDNLDRYRDDAAQRLSAILERPVELGRLTGEWRGLDPRFHFHDLRLLDDEGNPWLHLQEARVNLALTGLLHGYLEPVRLQARIPSLTLRRDKDGIWLNGQPMWGQSQPGMQRWLFKREALRLDVGRLELQGFSDQDLTFEHAQIQLRLSEDELRLRGAVRGSEEDPVRLNFALDTQGSWQQPETVDTHLYIDTELPLSGWDERLGLERLPIDRGQVRLRVWAEGSLKKLQRASLKVDVQHLFWDSELSAEQRRQVTSLAAQIHWQRQAQGELWLVEDLRWDGGDGVWPAAASWIRWQQQADGHWQSQGYLPRVVLADLQPLLAGLQRFKPDAFSVLAGRQMDGVLNDLHWHIQASDEGIQTRVLRSQFSDLSWSDNQSGLLLDGLDGSVRARPEGAHITLQGQDSLLAFGKLFRQPLFVSRLTGDVFVTPQDNAWLVRADNLQAENADVKTQSRIHVQLRPQQKPFLDLRVHFKDGDMAHAGRYLPTGIMPPKVVDWLDRALLQGRVAQGGMVYYGQAGDFPFREEQGLFRVDFEVTEGELATAPHWPRVTDMQGRFLFENQSFTGRIQSGLVGGIKLQHAQVKIPDLGRDAVLKVQAALDDRLQTILQGLSVTPFGGPFAEFIAQTEAEGPADLQFDFQLPLTRLQNYRVDGHLGLKGNRLNIPQWHADFAHLKGDVHFNVQQGRHGFRARKVKAQFNSQPATIDINTVSPSAGQSETRIDVRTVLNASQLVKSFAAQFSERVRGKADALLGLRIKARDDAETYAVSLQVDSDMRGIRVDLPDGLGKSELEARRLRVSLPLNQDNTAVQFSLQDRFSGIWHQGALSLHLGGGEAQWPRQGLSISGRWPQLDISEWLAMASEAPPDAQRLKQRLSLQAVNLHLDRLRYNAFLWNEVHLRVQAQSDYWQSIIRSQELAGELRIPRPFSGETPLIADLAYWHVLLPEAQTQEASIDPRVLPPLQLRCEKFVFNGTHYGQLDLKATPSDKGIRVDNVHMFSPYLDVSANGTWEYEQGRQMSRFRIHTETSNMGRALRLWGYQNAIREGTAQIDIRAAWPGPPQDYELSRLDGELKMVIKNGQILDVNPGGGRIFGLLSLNALPRRLSLDFRDVFRKGLAFDIIEGRFVVEDGHAYTNDFYLDGPAARIEMSGRIGLASQDYDQQVVVQPRVASSMPLLGGLAGGPQVGVGLWIADKLFGDKIDKMGRAYYQLRGSWDDPQVDKLKSPDQTDTP